MTNRAVILAVVGGLLCFGAWWFTQNYGFGKERVWVGYSGEARVNPYFAARLLLERLGFKVHQRAELRQLDALPAGAFNISLVMIWIQEMRVYWNATKISMV